ncbi:lymphocyte cytosolic protein 2a [Diretmus argenteus]
MSFERVPSKSEVMGWSPHHLADYLRKMNLSGSDKVVMKYTMNGSRFVNMSENDLQKFPKLHAPMISKICSEINKKEDRRGLFGKKPTDSDDDYEDPNGDGDGGSVGDYESPTEEFEDRDGANDNDYEPPPSEPAEDLAHKLCPTLPMGDSTYIGRSVNTVEQTVTHPWRPQPEALEPPPSWIKPPVPPPPSSTSVSRSNSSAVRPPPNRHMMKAQLPGTTPSPSKTKVRPPDLDPLHDLLTVSHPGFHPLALFPKNCSLDMDPSWYVGKVTRRQAEDCLRQVNKDGAFLVRDSTKQLSSQPFTLMVLYQDKVYNIQIRHQNQHFLLGTGLKAHETFPTVIAIISHYAHSPLVLIDTKNRGSGQQNQCLLSNPAAYRPTRQNWS